MIMLGERNDNLLQYYCLEGPMDRAAWQAAVHRVAKIWTQLSMLTCNENNVKHLFIYWLAIHISSLETVYPGPLPIFIFNCFLLLSCMNSLYILDINPLSIYCSQILLPNHSLAFHLAVPFTVQKPFSLYSPIYLYFISLPVFYVSYPKIIAKPHVKELLSIFSSRISMISGITFKP